MQLTPTSAVQHEFWQRRAVPPLEEVRRGVWAVPVPVPGHPIRFTYCYVIAHPSGNLVLDPGADTPESWTAITTALGRLGIGDDVRGIVVSHFHFDHWQLADRLAARTGAWVAVGQAEHTWISALTEVDLTVDAARERFASWGAPEPEAELLARTEDYAEPLGYDPPGRLLRDGELLADGTLRVLVTPGHSPGHLCLWDADRGLLLSGDHVLPGITPYVALNPFGPSDPLGDYLRSLDRLRACGDPEVLPAHEYRFSGLSARLDALEEQVASRLAEVRRALSDDPEGTPWSVARSLTWSRSWEDFGPLARRMAVSETAAYLAHAEPAAGGRPWSRSRAAT